MSRYYRPTHTTIGFGGGLTPGVKTLMITAGIVFLVQVIDSRVEDPSFTYKFGLTPAMVTGNYYLWQLVTYIFLHGGFVHILFNMFALWMFGSELERHWGTREFTKFFFICGVGAGLTTLAVGPGSMVTTIGASGSIYGILLAYGLLFPRRIIFLYFIIPIEARYFVMMIGAITFFSSVSATGGGIAHIAHLGGMIFGLLYLRTGRLTTNLRWRYEQWRRNRLRRKFDVYYEERHRDNDRRDWRN